jgi:hypothetical protein
VREESGGLKNVADPSAKQNRIEAGYILTVDQDATGGGVDHPVDHPEQCCFA